MERIRALSVTSLLVMVSLTACGSPDAAPVSQDDGGATTVAVGDRWQEIVTTAEGSEIRFDVTGHFSSSRGVCTRRREFGQVQPTELAHKLLSAANDATAKPPSAREYCLPGGGAKHVTSFVKVTGLGRGEVTLFNPRGTEVCTQVVNQTAAKALLDALNRSLELALKEGC